MLTVIFGAGASYDSDPDNPPPQNLVNQHEHRPPLANKLFEVRGNFIGALKRFPQCYAIVPWLRHLRPGTSIEEILEELFDEARNRPDVEREKQLAAVRFYLQTVIDGCARSWHGNDYGNSNYLTLLDEIRHFGNTSVCLITFNYDQLIDLSLQRLTGLRPNTLPEYLNWDRFGLYKVHGSVDWGRVVRNHQTYAHNEHEHVIAALIKNAAQLEVTDDYRLVRESHIPIIRDGDDVLLPAVAVPIQTKQEFECPPDHIVDLKAKLQVTDRVLIIGWRAMDQHFVALLKSHLPRNAKIQIVCGKLDHAREVETNLKNAGLPNAMELLSNTFSSYVLERAGRDFLTPASVA